MQCCRYLVHVAALYSFSAGMHHNIIATNVQGSVGVLEAAHQAGIERAIVTSSSSTVGPGDEGRPATEDDWDVEDGFSAYHQSKLQQARRALAAQIPVVLVLPTAPVGPGDWKPTPTGKMIVDFMRGRIFATLFQYPQTDRRKSKNFVPLPALSDMRHFTRSILKRSSDIALSGGLNIVAVEDVARAHVLALQYGHPHERYLVGGENISLSHLWERLAQICGRPAPTMRIPFSLALTLGRADELRCRIFHNGTGGMAAPLIPLEGVRMARHLMYVSSAKAESELGYAATSVDAALERAVQWYRDNGYAS
jgi:dihydroflavonol-4-reductase